MYARARRSFDQSDALVKPDRIDGQARRFRYLSNLKNVRHAARHF
jgi:hypothetical protein